ncbi:hypothetical protein [Sediminicola sp. 1XM1-17]|uniref:hypothetical protein n=1 Tax=Sediminicola sp. 1XM1-17 TaxID=3127702 RepID=UPI0030787F5C
MIKKTNIEEKLLQVKEKRADPQKIIQEVYQILNDTSKTDLRIEKNLGNGKTHIENAFDFDQLETQRIYHIDQIKQICIDYRLRFLDSKYFKGDIPDEAISEIKNLENKHDLELQGYKIIAPSKMFKLKDKDDPLLFAPIGNDYYYLIHKWGNDLHPLRRIFAWPFKSIVNLTLIVLLGSYLLTLLVPSGLFSKGDSNAEFWIIFFFMFKSAASVIIFYGFALGKNFNPGIWNSKYFNT